MNVVHRRSYRQPSRTLPKRWRGLIDPNTATASTRARARHASCGPYQTTAADWPLSETETAAITARFPENTAKTENRTLNYRGAEKP